MILSYNKAARAMKEVMPNDGRLQRKGVLLLDNLVQQFIRNVTENSIPFMREAHRTTLMDRDIEHCIDAVSLILKNYPKIRVKDENNSGVSK